MNEHLTTLEGLMARHDWYYEYSDDYSAWGRGRDQRSAILAEQRRLVSASLATAEEISALNDRYRPKNA
jgi:hypothetical protein